MSEKNQSYSDFESNESFDKSSEEENSPLNKNKVYDEEAP